MALRENYSRERNFEILLDVWEKFSTFLVWVSHLIILYY